MVKLKNYREKTGMTQKQMAKRIGVNPTFYSRVESGHVDLPLRHFKKAARVLGFDVDLLVNAKVKKIKARILDQI